MLYRKFAFSTVVLLVGLGSSRLIAQDDPGQTYFKTNCALCHADALGAGDTEVIRQGPVLWELMGEKRPQRLIFSIQMR